MKMIHFAFHLNSLSCSFQRLMNYVSVALGYLANLSSCLFQNGFAVVRPPGHHAEESTAMSVHAA